MAILSQLKRRLRFAIVLESMSELDLVIDDAKRICPPLREAETIERWAGVRPKAGKPDPMLGPLPERQNIIVATGGFKITFAIAHIMADIAVKLAIDESADIPKPFLPATRLLKLR